MTDYPTRAQIDLTADTLETLQLHLERSAPGFGAAWSGLETARQILVAIDDFPGLHYPDAEPEPEPEPTAAEVLREACRRAEGRSVSKTILWAAVMYAEAHPEWFAEWHAYERPSRALMAAATEAQNAGDNTAPQLLNAASHVAADRRALFGGAV